MKAAELKTKSIDELKTELFALLREQFNLRVQKSMGQPPKGHLLSSIKLSIARIKTILKEKGLSV